MDVKKRNFSVEGKRIYAKRQANQEDGKWFPAMSTYHSLGSRTKMNVSSNLIRNVPQNKLNQVNTTFCLPRIRVNREPTSVSKRWYSQYNLCSISTSNDRLDHKTSTFNSIGARKRDFQFKDGLAISREENAFNSSRRLMKTLRIVDFEITEKNTKLQQEKSLSICRMELVPRCTGKPKNKTTPMQKLSRSELQVTFPILKLTSTDQSAIFSSSPSLSWSMESLDSIVGGTLSLTQPPPEILSSCSPSTTEVTPPSTP